MVSKVGFLALLDLGQQLVWYRHRIDHSVKMRILLSLSKPTLSHYTGHAKVSLPKNTEYIIVQRINYIVEFTKLIDLYFC